MGSYDFMKQQIDALLSKGFNCIKIKIGALDFDEELSACSLSCVERYDANTVFRLELTLTVLFHSVKHVFNSFRSTECFSNYILSNSQLQLNQWEIHGFFM